MARSYNRYVPSDEPMTFDAEDVAAVLERLGRPRMAEYVRNTGNVMKRQAFVHEKLIEDYTRVLAKLHSYEPPKPVHEPHCPFPPPERSD